MARFLRILFTVFLFLGIATVVAAYMVVQRYGDDLPDYAQLADYEPPVTTRVHAGDGRMLAEYATQHRLFVPIDVIPQSIVDAFLAAEDKNFFEHPGIDVSSVARAMVTNLVHIASGRRPVGGSTITQQVAKNFLLTNEVSVDRKIKEALLAFRIEQALSKERILELYLNEIYLGYGSYGVAAAAMNYFNKSLDDVTLAEAAFLAALPKAPNNYNPVSRNKAARDRRDWVIDRMLEDGRIDRSQAEAAWAQPLEVHKRDDTEYVTAPWFSEEVRREIVARFGDKALYEGGLSVRSTLDMRMQRLGEKALRDGLIDYDRRHGWRGPIAQISAGPGWQERLAGIPRLPSLGDWELAVVLSVDGGGATVGLDDGRSGTIPFDEMNWARPWLEGERVGAPPRRPSDVLSAGDVVAVEAKGQGAFALRQIPAVDGGLVALDPQTGRVLALVGGFSPDRSQFNRATQAKRQPGSAFKPFVYLAALESDFTPATIILDAPIEFNQGPGLGVWRPKNYAGDTLGPVTMRTGLEKSRNLMTIRLAQHIGIDKVAAYAERFGIFDKMPRVLSMSLGAGETTLLRLTNAYGEIANGGKQIEASLIDRVQDRTGRTIYRHDDRSCDGCSGAFARSAQVPPIIAMREQLADPVSIYQVTSMMQGVIERGTATRVRIPGHPLAGKTGTTNDSFDSWFVGFSTSLVVGVYVGFDTPRTLGPRETGSSVAAPVFKEFMQEALEFMPSSPFPVPPGAKLVRISRSTGLPPEPGAGDVILEAFKPGTEPRWRGPVIGDTMEMTAPQYGIGPDPGFYPQGQYAGSYDRQPAAYGGWDAPGYGQPAPATPTPGAAAPYDPQRLYPPSRSGGGGGGGGGAPPPARSAPAPSPSLQGLY